MAQKNISLPFSLNSSGSISFSTNESKIWSDRVFLVLMTSVGERVQESDFGSNIKSMLFETEEVAISAVGESVESAFSRWLPQLTLLDVQTRLDNATAQLSITISYRLPNLQEDTLTFSTALFSRSGDFIREIN
jgi:phage baseplate assembly protein W